MEDELLAKMHGRIEAGIGREEDLLFFLVKARKLLERKDLKGDYPLLRFYCDWSVHAAMDRQGARQILERVDDLTDRHLKGDANALREVASLLSLGGFRAEIARFCNEFRLPDYLAADSDVWDQFRYLFVSNISDCPLILLRPSRHVRALAFA